MKRLVRYRNGIAMADTLGGRYIAVKPDLVEETSPWPITTLVTECRWTESSNPFLADEFQDGGSRLFSDFLKSGNQLGNIDANHCAFAQPAVDIELKIGPVKHAQPLPHVA